MNRKISFDSPRLRAALETLTLAFSSDKSLRAWFHTLETLAYNLRMNAILQITTEMRHGGEDPDLIDALAALSDPDLYDALKETLEALD
jgi:hypothetical protein